MKPNRYPLALAIALLAALFVLGACETKPLSPEDQSKFGDIWREISEP